MVTPPVTPLVTPIPSSSAYAVTRRGILAGGAAGAAGLLARCGSPEASQPRTAGAAPAEIRLSVWADVQDWDVYTAMIDDFQKAQSSIRVSGEQYKGAGVNYYEKMQTLVVAGEAADGNYFQGWYWQPYSMKSLLLPLDALMGKDKAMQRVVPPNYESMSKFRGKTYVLTADTGPMVIFYNKELFDKAGVPYPKEGWTLDDLVDKARKLTRQDGGQKYWGCQVNGGYLRNFPWIRLNGAREWDRVVEPKKSQWDSPGVAKELQLQYNFKNVQAFVQTQKFGSINLIGGVSEDDITRADGAGLGQAINDMLDGKVTAKEALTVVSPKFQSLLDTFWARNGGK